MKTRSSTTCCLLLLLAVPAWGESPPIPPGGAGSEVRRPLNLSLPRDVLGQPSMVIRNDADETAARNLRQEGAVREKRPALQRYGTGYEARQRGVAAESGTGYVGGGMVTPMGGGAGMGGGGRGGMGRGR